MSGSWHNVPSVTVTNAANNQVYTIANGNGVSTIPNGWMSSGVTTFTNEENKEYQDLLRERDLQTALERKLLFRRFSPARRAAFIERVEMIEAAYDICGHVAKPSAREQELGRKADPYYGHASKSTHQSPISHELGLSLDDLKEAHRDQCAEDMITNFRGA